MARPSRHHPGLDGLRGVAVVMVLLFHSGLGWLSGGFLGVSIFFTLSGYLITTLLLAEVEERERLDIGAFWSRRLRRLLPASLAAITAVVLLAPLFSTAVEESRIRGDAISAVLYVSNWRYVQAGLSYEELFSSMSPLLHLWSLSIEAQMYIVVPLVVIAGSAVGLRRRGLAVVMALGIGASVLTAVFLVDGDRVYYGTDTRAAELLVGAFLACVWKEPSARRAGGAVVVAVRGLLERGLSVMVLLAVVVLARFTTTSSDWVYSGALGGFGFLSAILVVGSIRPGPLRAILSLKPLVHIGQVSYGLYLYHWPIFVWLTPERANVDGVALFGVQLLVTAMVTVVSYIVIETPIRRRRFLTSPQLTRSVAAAAVVVSLLLPLVFLHSYRTVIKTEQVVLTTVAPQDPVSNVDPQRRPLRVVVLGDSTAENMARALADVADPDLGVMSAGVIGCPLVAVARVYDRPGSTQDATYCPDTVEVLRKYVLNRHIPDFDVVVIVAGVANQWDFELPTSSEIIRVGSERYNDLLAQWMLDVHSVLAESGIPVLIFDAPMTRQNESVLGDEPNAVAAWNAVITSFDDTWVSVRKVPLSDFLSDPDSDVGRLERPDGVHLDRDFAARLARTSLIPVLREIYDEILIEMLERGCRIPGVTPNRLWMLDIDRCRN